jgi:hypothetical protein
MTPRVSVSMRLRRHSKWLQEVGITVSFPSYTVLWRVAVECKLLRDGWYKLSLNQLMSLHSASVTNICFVSSYEQVFYQGCLLFMSCSCSSKSGRTVDI